MLVLGIDLGTSSVKVSVVDAATQKIVAAVSYPDSETDVISLQPGWAEQSPATWWENITMAILRCHAENKYDPKDISAIGIAYQMHGLVLVDKEQHVLRNSIIWCDSRAVQIGEEAFENMGHEKCLGSLLNSPGNFTASKLAWVKGNEPAIYDRTDKFLLPGDFIAMRLTGNITTTISALSEGVFWNFPGHQPSKDVIRYFGFNENIFPAIQPVFSDHGRLQAHVATELKMRAGIPITYKAGDQLNNALSLNVLQPGEVAATAGTSGVIYGVSEHFTYDPLSRINSFAHVNHQQEKPRVGVLLCINGVGIFYRWLRELHCGKMKYAELNQLAAKISPGSNGLLALPFGNGAERMLENSIAGGHFHNLDFNTHSFAHMARAVQEGIAFSFRYGLDIMRENNLHPTVARAAKTNLFLSDVFVSAFVNATGVGVEFYEGDGSFGAAIGAALGAGFYKNENEALSLRKPVGIKMPEKDESLETSYASWKMKLGKNEKLKSNQ
jgi:xylulokinase